MVPSGRPESGSVLGPAVVDTPPPLFKGRRSERTSSSFRDLNWVISSPTRRVFFTLFRFFGVCATRNVFFQLSMTLVDVLFIFCPSTLCSFQSRFLDF